MKYFEFGQEHPELMVMLHGGGTSYRGMLPTAQEMARVYHVVLVAYDGASTPTSRRRSSAPPWTRPGGWVTFLCPRAAAASKFFTAFPTAAGC